MVVAGGGGGGLLQGGGGGAGGYRNSVSGETSGRGSVAETPLTLALATNYTVTVGAGGAGRSSEGRGTTGSNYRVVLAAAAHIPRLAEQAQPHKATTDKQAAHQQQVQAVEQAEHLQDFLAALLVQQ